MQAQDACWELQIEQVGRQDVSLAPSGVEQAVQRQALACALASALDSVFEEAPLTWTALDDGRSR